jgi:hypothetical protein
LEGAAAIERSVIRVVWFLGLVGVGWPGLLGGEPDPRRTDDGRATPSIDRLEDSGVVPISESEEVPFWRDPNRWSFQFGVGWITGSTIGEVSTGQVRLADGDAGGRIYLMQASMTLAEWEPRIAGTQVRMNLELPLVLGLVDERGRDLFPQYSGGIALRWKSFPWNRWVHTNLETGIGLTYSHHVLAIERARYPDRERSHLEFHWPIQVTVAHPKCLRHQLVLFSHHHSGGQILHRGGANSLGLGYRLMLGP